MPLPCNRPCARTRLDRAYIAIQLDLSEYEVKARLHALKRAAGLRGDESVVICLDDGEVYDSLFEEAIGNLYDP